MENVIMTSFKVESEAYQAFSELKRDMASSSYIVSQAVLIKREGNALITCEAFDSGIDTHNDTVKGEFIGAFVGILGGPLGMLLGFSFGGLIGATADMNDISRNGSVMEKIAANISEGSIAILALVQEQGHIAIDSKFSKFDCITLRYDAAELQAEIEDAKKLQKEMEKQAKAELRKEKSEERKEKIEQFRQKLKDDFKHFKDEHFD